jgi:hypothetical protein
MKPRESYFGDVNREGMAQEMDKMWTFMTVIILWASQQRN